MTLDSRHTSHAGHMPRGGPRSPGRRLGRTAGGTTAWTLVLAGLAMFVGLGVWYRVSKDAAERAAASHPTAEQIEVGGEAAGPLLDPATGLLPKPVGHTPSLAFTERSGREIALRDLKGEVLVADFVFTSCGSVCRRMTKAMSELQAATAELPGDGPPLRMLSFSVDPERDTPEKMTAFANEFGADPERWYFLRGDIDDVKRVSVEGFLVGHKDQPVFHSEKFVLLDVWGRVRAYYDPLTDKDWKPKLMAGIAALRNEAHTGLLAYGDFGLLDQPATERSGKELRTGDLLGDFLVVDFIFTRCQATCPDMSRAMAELQAATKEHGDVRCVSFTVDPEHDSPEVLSKYADDVGAETDRWLFLSTNEAAVTQIAYHGMGLGHVSKAIMHSEQFALIDRRGQLRGYYRPLQDPQWLERMQRGLDVLRAEPQ